MLKHKSQLLTVALVAAAMIIVAAGGVAIASNMAFKINRVLIAGGAGNIGRNDVSLPYFMPYTANCTTAPNACGGALCQQLGLPGGLGQTTLQAQDEFSSAFGAPVTCPTATATTGPAFAFVLRPGKGVRIRPPTTWPTGGSVIIVGSHNPALSILVPDAGVGQIGRYWFSVPYHTTAVTTRDLCLQSGLSAVIGGASITRLNPSTGAFQNAACTANPGFTLTLGEFVQVVEPNGPKTFVPAHF